MSARKLLSQAQKKAPTGAGASRADSLAEYPAAIMRLKSPDFEILLGRSRKGE